MKNKPKKYYSINGMNRTATLNILGLEHKIELSWIEGQVGAMPIFDDYNKAKKYADKHNYTISELKVEI